MAGHDDFEWASGVPHRLWRANQSVHRLVVEATESLGVTVTQLGICVHLDEFGHMSASDLARLFQLTPQSVTTALGRLESLGWVRRLPHPVHKRVIWYEVTEAGTEAVAEGRARVSAVDQRVRAALAPELLENLDRILVSLSEIFGSSAQPSPGPLWPAPLSTSR